MRNGKGRQTNRRSNLVSILSQKRNNLLAAKLPSKKATRMSLSKSLLLLSQCWMPTTSSRTNSSLKVAPLTIPYSQVSLPSNLEKCRFSTTKIPWSAEFYWRKLRSKSATSSRSKSMFNAKGTQTYLSFTCSSRARTTTPGSATSRTTSRSISIKSRRILTTPKLYA